jgi:hypothetical protein
MIFYVLRPKYSYFCIDFIRLPRCGTRATKETFLFILSFLSRYTYFQSLVGSACEMAIRHVQHIVFLRGKAQGGYGVDPAFYPPGRGDTLLQSKVFGACG